MSDVLETQVVIIGAGPVGLGMAIELSQRGIECAVVEEGDGTVAHPRTGLVAIRTMELLRRWGLAEPVRNCGFPDDYQLSMVFCTSLNGMLLDREDYPSMRDTPTPAVTPEKKQRCPQMWLQPILLQAAQASERSTFFLKHRFDQLSQDSNGIEAAVTNLVTGSRLTLRGKYLLGCDGVTSNVRRQLGIEVDERLLSYSVNILFRAPDLTKKHSMGEAERYMFVGPEGMWGNLTVIDGRELWRLTVLGSEEKMDLATFDARHWITRALGTEDDAQRIPFEILSVVPWRRAELLAQTFQNGRAVLAGDSAHAMSPTGGMGMNTGMQEVLDLGWKLQGALQGWGGPRLLASYQVERRPVAARNITFSTQNFRAWKDTVEPGAVLDQTPEGAAVRSIIGRLLREATRVEWESVGLQIGHRYDESLICLPDGSPCTSDEYDLYVPTSRPGSRAPHAWLADGRSTLDLFGEGFVLLSFKKPSPDVEDLVQAFSVRQVPFKVVSIDDPQIADLYELSLVLVRPDGHVAWRGDSVVNPLRIVDIVRGAL
jgi:2-polyprenyl-6-methoxyphenol hydroxylase-like FAD-dependent oxidoreductase